MIFCTAKNVLIKITEKNRKSIDKGNMAVVSILIYVSI